MLLNYILAFAFGYLACDIVNGVKRRLKEYPILEAMQAQQKKDIEDSFHGSLRR